MTRIFLEKDISDIKFLHIMLILLNRSIFDLDIKKLTKGFLHTRIDFEGCISLFLSRRKNIILNRLYRGLHFQQDKTASAHLPAV